MRADRRAFLLFWCGLFCGAWLSLSLAAMSAEPDTAKLDAAKPEAKPEAPLAYISVAGAPGDGETGARRGARQAIVCRGREDRHAFERTSIRWKASSR